MVRKQSYAFVRICVPSCQTTPVIEYKFHYCPVKAGKSVFEIVET